MQVIVICSGFWSLKLGLIYFQVNEKLFPCNLSIKNEKLTEEAVKLAVQKWGKRSLTELEAEERLSYSCEKVIILRILNEPLIILLKFNAAENQIAELKYVLEVFFLTCIFCCAIMYSMFSLLGPC